MRGGHPGSVLVSNRSNPRAALIYGPEGYLIGGDFEDSEFATTLKEYFDLLYETDSNKRQDSCDLFYTAEWESLLYRIFDGRFPMKHPRNYYVIVLKKTTPFIPQIPEPLKLERIDQPFFEKIQRLNFNEIRSRVSEWSSDAVFLNQGFGFCLLDRERIVT